MHDRDLRVTPLDGYDIILGKPWLTHYNPEIDWEANIVTVTVDGTVHRLSSPGLELPGHASAGIQLLSGIQLADGAAQGEEVFLMHVEASGDIYDGMPGRQNPILLFSELHTMHADEGPSFADHLAPILAQYASVSIPLPDKRPPDAQLTTRLTLKLGLYLPIEKCLQLVAC